MFMVIAMYVVIIILLLLLIIISNAQRGNGIRGERGLRTKPGFLEPCRAENNKGSNMQGSRVHE